MKMPYSPKPIDTSQIVLGKELHPLIERLAENAHNVWARMRIDDGWTHGMRRDDDLKLHPCLVHYRELPESEKKYDRALASEVIKVIMALGYRIEPGSEA